MLDKDKEKDKKYQEQDEDNEAEKEMLRVKKCIQKDTISENDENGTN